MAAAMGDLARGTEREAHRRLTQAFLNWNERNRKCEASMP
jgi:hypothetical protein